MTAIGYRRGSTEDQAKEGVSLDNQKSKIEAYCQLKDLYLSEGENIGWVQNMLGHGSLQMIFTKYYAWIPKKTRNDGSAFMNAYGLAKREMNTGD